MGIRSIDANEQLDLYKNTDEIDLDNFSVPIPIVRQNIIDARTLDYEPIRCGCEYCSGERVLYQTSSNTELYISTFGLARTLETKSSCCPPYVDCCAKDMSIRSVFIINFCPNCGRKLTDEEVKDNENS